jgi:peptidoglycan hydrolase-like protein with peptidoglycan-binding domain
LGTGYELKYDSYGSDVLTLQKTLNAIEPYYAQIGKLDEDGIFGNGTRSAVIAFQSIFGLQPDGIVGSVTGNKLMQVYASVSGSGGVSNPAYIYPAIYPALYPTIAENGTVCCSLNVLQQPLITVILMKLLLGC